MLYQVQTIYPSPSPPIKQDNKDKLHILAASLLEKEVLDYHQIQELIGEPPNGKKNVMEPQGWENLDKRRY